VNPPASPSSRSGGAPSPHQAGAPPQTLYKEVRSGTNRLTAPWAEHSQTSPQMPQGSSSPHYTPKNNYSTNPQGATIVSQQYTLELRFGNAILEAGFTAVPNLFLQHYHHLGLSDSQAMWVIHLLRYKWTANAPFPRQSSLPMTCSEKTRRRHAAHLRSRGLLFTRRIYHTNQTAPSTHLIGKLCTLEYHLDTLLHNVTRVADHIQNHRLSPDFAIELKFDTVKRVATGWYHDVPGHIKILCERHLIATVGQPLLLLPQNGPVAVTTTPKATSSFCTSRKPTSRFWERHEEDSDSHEDTTDPKEEETSTTTPIDDVDDNINLCNNILYNMAIFEPTKSEILQLPYITSKYLEAWQYWYDENDDKISAGFIVSQIRRGETAPLTKCEQRYKRHPATGWGPGAQDHHGPIPVALIEIEKGQHP